MVKRFEWRTAFCVLLATGSALAATSALTFHRKDGKVSKFVVASAQGRIEIVRHIWSNTSVFTESGKRLALIDPFMYASHGRLADGKKVGGYYSKPEAFDTWKVEQIEVPGRDDASIVKISADVPGGGLRKEVVIALDKKENVAYVYNRLTATQDVTLNSDRQTIYLSRPATTYSIWADGKEVTPENRKKTDIERHLVFQHKKSKASAAVVFPGRKLQKYRHSDKAPLGIVIFHIEGKRNGTDCYWHKGSGKLTKGQALVQQYILLWGDGDLKEKAEALSKKALAGELNHKFPVLP